MGMWNREKETLSRDELAKVQLEGLKKSLNRVWNNEFYRERLKKGGVGSTICGVYAHLSAIRGGETLKIPAAS